MYEVNISDKIGMRTELPHRIIWGMPSRQQLQEAANLLGFTIIIFTCGNEHILTTNKLLHRKLDSLQIRKNAVRNSRMLKHYIIVYSAPPFNDRQAAEAYFAAMLNGKESIGYEAPASTRRGRLNLIDTVL